ncbi:AraC family transcriptional regulator [Ottowia thiooxydans]|uniref:AraC family transcriptional regulator n=1 Tax=Ottowia thiooxydans TaxID=219182 RepID=UPI0004210456|nr:AraC family transcriptional regulator [Ottowia thiooxydans]
MSAVLNSPRPDADDPTSSLEQVANRLLEGLRWQARIFHVGQYCGRWRASTSGHSQASFHLVLHGRCWLHRPGHPCVALGPRDGVFLLRDMPHFISPYEDANIACPAQPMQPLQATGSLGATGLACGFFSFDGPTQALVTGAFPDVLVLRAGQEATADTALLFELMLREAQRSAEPGSAALDRLSGLLFFYALRQLAVTEPQVGGVLGLLRQPGFAPLVLQLLEAPEQPWSVEAMARHVHLSRAALFRRFQSACGQSPLQFLLLIRMQVATQRLSRGESIARVAEAVGYESVAAFARAFKRTMGQQPGAWRRSEACQDGPSSA